MFTLIGWIVAPEFMIFDSILTAVAGLFGREEEPAPRESFAPRVTARTATARKVDLNAIRASTAEAKARLAQLQARGY